MMTFFTVRLHVRSTAKRYNRKFRFDLPPQLTNKYSRMTVYRPTFMLDNTTRIYAFCKTVLKLLYNEGKFNLNFMKVNSI